MTIKAICLDISGVLCEGNVQIPGAAEAVEALRAKGASLRFVTNTASQSTGQLLNKMAMMGIAIEDEELFTAPLAAKRYIQSRNLRPFCLIHKSLQQDFSDIDQHNSNAVLLGDARDELTYSNLNRVFQLCEAGAPLIGIGMNKYFSEDGALMLDAGAFIRAIEWAAGINAIIMGKPSKDFFQQVVKSLECEAAQCLMVGDDVLGDVQGAVDAGLQAVLVRTGKYREEDAQRCPSQADMIDSIVDLPDYLTKHQA